MLAAVMGSKLMSLLLLILAFTSSETISEDTGDSAVMHSLYSRTRNITSMTQRVVKVVQQVAQGPARLKNLVLHLDPALPGELQDALLMRQRRHLPSTTSLLHLVIGMGSFPFKSNRLSSAVHPIHNLLLVNLGSDHNATSLLFHPVLRKIKNLAVMTPVSSGLDPLATYTLFPFCSPSLHYLGQWSQHTFPTWESLFPDRFPSTCRATFKLATWINDVPYLYHRQPDNKTVGVSLTLLQELASKLNFSYTMTAISVDGLWGLEENGKWYGLFGMIHRGDYDFTINNMFNTEKRVASFDELEPLGYGEVAVFLQNTSPLPDWMNLVRPFPLSVWGLLVTAFLLTSLCFVLQARVGGRGWNADVAPLRAILAQSAPRLTEPGLFACLWLLSCLVLTAAYTSNLVGIFTKPVFPPRLTSLSQLASSDKRLAAMDDGSVVVEILKDDDDPSIRPFRGRVDFYVDEKRVVEAMTADTHGYVAVKTYTSLVLRNKFHLRNWYLLRESIGSFRTGWYFQKNTPWKEKFDKYIKGFKEAGLVGFWLKNEMDAIGYATGNKTRDEGVDGGTRGPMMGRRGGPITTSHLQGLFSILGLAWSLSTALFLFEMIHKKTFCWSRPPCV